MSFRSRRQRDESTDSATDEVSDEALDRAVGDDEGTGTVEETDITAGSETAPEESADAPSLAELDEQDWRDLGPYDLDEVDRDVLETEIEENTRIDLGSIVLAATDGMELRLQVDEASQQI